MQRIEVDPSKPLGEQETLIDMTDSEIEAATAMAASLEISVNKNSAREFLDKSDITILRCTENQIPVPAEWATYRASLRAIMISGQGDLPTQPPYPQGT